MTASAEPRPTVTAIVPTRDRPAVLVRALRAILAQDYEGPIEVLVVFDRQEAVEPDLEVPEGRELRVITNTRSPGLAGARNSGALAARGRVLAFCDDDDEWLQGKLREQVALLLADPEASAATCGIEVVSNGRKTPRLPAGDHVTLDDLTRSRRMEVHSSTLVMTRARFDEIGFVDEEIPGGYGEDYDWILRAAAVGPLVAARRPLVRVHWQGSYYADRWQTIIPALQYQLHKHPELARDPGNLARIYGRLAFACAASGRRREALDWAKRSMRLDWKQPRGYLALLIASGLLRPAAVQRVANSFGRGV